MNFTKLNVEGKVCLSASSSPRLVPNVGKLAEERDKTFVASASAALSPLEAARLSASRFPRVSPLSARAERLKKPVHLVLASRAAIRSADVLLKLRRKTVKCSESSQPKSLSLPTKLAP